MTVGRRAAEPETGVPGGDRSCVHRIVDGYVGLAMDSLDRRDRCSGAGGGGRTKRGPQEGGEQSKRPGESLTSHTWYVHPGGGGYLEEERDKKEGFLFLLGCGEGRKSLEYARPSEA